MQEPDRLPVPKILHVLGATLIIGTGALFAADFLGLAHGRRPTKIAYGPAQPLGTVEKTLFQESHRGDVMRETQKDVLERYGWVDRANGVARIPIRRAMDLRLDANARTR